MGREYHEIAKVVSREVIREHSEREVPDTLNNWGGDISFQRYVPETTVLTLRGEASGKEYVWKVYDQSCRERLASLNTGTRVDVFYQTVLFGILGREVRDVRPIGR